MAKNKLTLCAPCLFGLESILAFETKRIGGEDVQAADGRVTFTGDFDTLARANLWLRTAERVCVVLGSFPASTFTELFDEVEQLPFEDFIGRADAFPVKGWSLKSQLHSIPSCQSIIKKAAAKRLGGKYGLTTLPETGAVHQIQFSILKDQVTVMLDTSGEGLHKRGYRTAANIAPMKETLAAGILDLARVKEGSTVVDPMCGSGTLLIEAALRAKNIAPGLSRPFAAEQWGSIPRAVWKEERETALEAIRLDAPFEGMGYDNDPEAISITLDNAKRAGVARYLQVQRQDISLLALKGDETVVCNPPYGERIATTPEAEELYRKMGAVMVKSAAGKYIISPHEEFERLFGKRADKKRKLYNGMIECNLFQYFGGKKQKNRA